MEEYELSNIEAVPGMDGSGTGVLSDPAVYALDFMQIINRPVWWILLFFIPFVNLVISVITMLDLGKSFGKDSTFSVLGLVLFNPVGIGILAFGKDKYIGAKAS
ncbi:MAG: DUF5684 domain-containing protein [Patescibacteria group bacterium]|nr:DUF5684 domain-containing protein [Patescibacteria group bacterium]